MGTPRNRSSTARSEFVARVIEHASGCLRFDNKEFSVLKSLSVTTAQKIRELDSTKLTFSDGKTEEDSKQTEANTLEERIKKLSSAEFVALQNKLTQVMDESKAHFDRRFESRFRMFLLGEDIKANNINHIDYIDRVMNDWPCFIPEEDYAELKKTFLSMASQCIVTMDDEGVPFIDEDAKSKCISFIHDLIEQFAKYVFIEKTNIISPELLNALQIPESDKISSEMLFIKLVINYVVNQVIGPLTQEAEVSDVSHQVMMIQRHIKQLTDPKESTFLSDNVRFFLALNKLRNFTQDESVYGKALALQKTIFLGKGVGSITDQVSRFVEEVNSIIGETHVALVDIDGCLDQDGELNRELIEKLKAENYDEIILFTQRSKFMCEVQCTTNYAPAGYRTHRMPFKLTQEVVDELSAALGGKSVLVSTSVDHFFGDPLKYYDKAKVGKFEKYYCLEYARFQDAKEQAMQGNVFDPQLKEELVAEQREVRGETEESKSNPHSYYPKDKVSQYLSVVPELKKKYPKGFKCTYYDDNSHNLTEVSDAHLEHKLDYTLKTVCVEKEKRLAEAPRSTIAIDSYQALVDCYRWILFNAVQFNLDNQNSEPNPNNPMIQKFIQGLYKFDVGKLYVRIVNSLPEMQRKNREILDQLYTTLHDIEKQFMQLRQCKEDYAKALPLVKPLLNNFAKVNELLQPTANAEHNKKDFPRKQRLLQQEISDKVGSFVPNPIVRWNMQRKLRVGTLEDKQVRHFVSGEKKQDARFLSKLHAHVAHATSDRELEFLKSVYHIAEKQNEEKIQIDNRSWIERNWKSMLGWTLLGVGVAVATVCTAGVGLAVVGSGALTAAAFSAGCGTVLTAIGGSVATGAAAGYIGGGVCVAGGLAVSAAIAVADHHYSQPTETITVAPKLTFKQKFKRVNTVPRLLTLMESGEEHKAEPEIPVALKRSKSEPFLRVFDVTHDSVVSASLTNKPGSTHNPPSPKSL